MLLNIYTYAELEKTEEFINVSGKAFIKVDPDFAVVSAGIYVIDTNLNKATSKANHGTDVLFKSIKKYKIREENVHTKDLQVYPKWNTHYKDSIFLGYIIKSIYDIKIYNLDNVNPFLEDIYLLGEIKISGIKFGIENQDSLTTSFASKDAYKNAVALTDGTGRKIGRLLNSSHEKPYDFDFKPKVRIFDDLIGSLMGGDGGALKLRRLTIKVIPPKIEVKSTIYVVYELK